MGGAFLSVGRAGHESGGDGRVGVDGRICAPPHSCPYVCLRRVALGDEGFVDGGKLAIGGVRFLFAQGPAVGDLVDHDGLLVEGGAYRQQILVLAVAAVIAQKDVDLDLVVAPEVGRAGEDLGDRGAVPLDGAAGALMFVDQAQGVAEFMQDDVAGALLGWAGGQFAQVHGDLAVLEGQGVGADVGPVAQAGIEGDADVGFPARDVPDEMEIGVFEPDPGELLDLVVDLSPHGRAAGGRRQRRSAGPAGLPEFLGPGRRFDGGHVVGPLGLSRGQGQGKQFVGDEPVEVDGADGLDHGVSPIALPESVRLIA